MREASYKVGGPTLMSEDHFQLLPQHKKMIIDRLKSFYKLDISEDEIDEIQREEPFVNFNYRQAELLRRIVVLQKICYPILKSHGQTRLNIYGV